MMTFCVILFLLYVYTTICMSILVVAIKKLQQQRVFVTKKELFF